MMLFLGITMNLKATLEALFPHGNEWEAGALSKKLSSNFEKTD